MDIKEFHTWQMHNNNLFNKWVNEEPNFKNIWVDKPQTYFSLVLRAVTFPTVNFIDVLRYSFKWTHDILKVLGTEEASSIPMFILR